MRSNLFQINGYVKEPLILPEGSGPPVIHSEKVYVPVKEHPDVSFGKKEAKIIQILSYGNNRFLSHKKCDIRACLPQKSNVVQKKAKLVVGDYFAPVFTVKSQTILPRL